MSWFSSKPAPAPAPAAPRASYGPAAGPIANVMPMSPEPQTGRWNVQTDTYTPKTHMLVDFEFGDGPLGLSFLKREGVFRVGSVLDGSSCRHVVRHPANRLSSEVTTRHGSAPQPVGDGRSGTAGNCAPTVGDRIVAVNGVLVDTGMTQSLLGDLIRRAPRPVRLTVEPIALSGDLISGGQGARDSVFLDDGDASELQTRRTESASRSELVSMIDGGRRGGAGSAAGSATGAVALAEKREVLAARVAEVQRLRSADEAVLRQRCADILSAFEAEYVAARTGCCPSMIASSPVTARKDLGVDVYSLLTLHDVCCALCLRRGVRCLALVAIADGARR